MFVLSKSSTSFHDKHVVVLVVVVVVIVVVVVAFLGETRTEGFPPPVAQGVYYTSRVGVICYYLNLHNGSSVQFKMITNKKMQ
jgi:hypothetical protein